MSNLAIIQRDDAKLEISFTQQAIQLKEQALDSSALVGKVTNAEENEVAVKAQTALNDVVKTVEKARKEAKEPLLDYGRRLDGAAKDFVKELVEELTRISKLTGDFATLEQAKVRAAEAAKREEENRIEKERQEALSKATSHEALDAVNEHFDRKQAALPVVEPVRAEGQIVKNDWSITVVDPHLLAKCHPTCVNITPRLSDIKELLNLGVDVKGIKATRIVTSTVRRSSGKMIEV